MRPRTHANNATGEVTRSKVLRGGVTCSKFAYTAKKMAKEYAGLYSKRTGEDIEAYHCYVCHCYHLGHRPGSRRVVA